MLGGLLFGQLAATHELVDQRVVLGEALQRPVAKQVRPAVPDVGDRQARVIHIRRGEGRSHPRAPVLLARALVDALVRSAHPVGQALLGAAVIRQGSFEGLDRELRSDLSGLRSAHPVRDDEHRGAGEGAVLVLSALSAGVRPESDLCDADHLEASSLSVIAGRRTRSRRS